MRLLAAGLLSLLLPPAAVAQLLAPRPVVAVKTGAMQDPDLTESSGVIRSRTMPHVLYTINDSGNDPVIFAIDSSGRPLGRWLVPGVRNRDWEAISIGACPAESCIYIGDTGDNEERHKTVTIYRVREPTRFERFRGAADPAPLDLDSAIVRYPDGPHDTEAMWLDAAGAVYLVTKGRSGGVKLFRLASSAFGSGRPADAVLVQLLPIAPDKKLGRWVTDAARSPDGRTVAIRTYTEIFLFPVAGMGRLGTPVICNVAGLEPQGEGIDWLDARRMVLTSENYPGGQPGPIHVVRCDA
ncbi:MAG: hypothetical protein ABI742_04835 [Gemmatimonadota bacterium]